MKMKCSSIGCRIIRFLITPNHYRTSCFDPVENLNNSYSRVILLGFGHDSMPLYWNTENNANVHPITPYLTSATKLIHGSYSKDVQNDNKKLDTWGVNIGHGSNIVKNTDLNTLSLVRLSFRNASSPCCLYTTMPRGHQQTYRAPQSSSPQWECHQLPCLNLLFLIENPTWKNGNPGNGPETWREIV